MTRHHCTCGRPINLIQPPGDNTPTPVVNTWRDNQGHVTLGPITDTRQWRHPDNTPTCTPPKKPATA